MCYYWSSNILYKNMYVLLLCLELMTTWKVRQYSLLMYLYSFSAQILDCVCCNVLSPTGTDYTSHSNTASAGVDSFIVLVLNIPWTSWNSALYHWNYLQKSLEVFLQKTKVMFTFSVSHQNTCCVFESTNKHVDRISFLMKHLQSHFFEYLKFCIIYIHVCLLAVFFTAFVGALLLLLCCHHTAE